MHCKKGLAVFPSPAGMSLTKLSLGGKNLYKTSLFPPRESLVSDIPAGDGKMANLFLQCVGADTAAGMNYNSLVLNVPSGQKTSELIIY
jgi:hypothetical protein